MSEAQSSSQLPQSSEGANAKNAEESLSPWSCYLCKNRKLRCDKAKPACGRCVEAGGDVCQYPSARKRPVITVTRPSVRRLEARLHGGELEDKLESQATASPETKFSSSELIDTGRSEQLPPHEVVEELTTTFFTRLQLDSSMIHEGKYVASLYRPSHMRPPMCLQYAILAAGASASSNHQCLAEIFYARARQYIQNDEMRNDGGDQISLAHAQAWVLLGHFEAQHLWFSRASLSIARAVRLGHILGLHRLDDPNAVGLALLPAADFSEEEERRKTFWVIFCTDRIASSTGGWPTMMDARTIRTRLPVSTEAMLENMPVSSLTLKQALEQDMRGLSTSACRVVAVHLFNECFNFSRGTDEDVDDNEWNRLQKLDNSIQNALETMPFDLRCPENVGNIDAVFINLQLHTALICIHQAATTRSQIGMDFMPEIHARVMFSALQITIIVALVPDINTSFRNPLISFAVYITATFFLTDFLSSGSSQSEEKLTALMDVMTEVGKNNTFTASLAVRLAQTLQTSGIDPMAVEKVEKLMATLNMDAPLPAQEDEQSGIVILCPVPHRSKDHASPFYL